MAHTLKAYFYTDPSTAVTVDFYGAVADNDGIAVTSYQMGMPGIEQARNNSLYSDSPRPVYSKHGTVTDVLTVDVRGSTNTNLYTNLHLLAKLGEYARRGSENPYVKSTAYIEMKPGGSAAGEVLYAIIYDCRADLPPDWANIQDSTLTIEDVTVTIERGLWQKYAPAAANTTNNAAATGVANASSVSSSVDIGGDTTAGYWFTVTQSSGATTINRAIIGYRSKALGGANYASLGKQEAEDQTNGTDTSDAADATASAGNKVQCTFATGTLATRLSGTSIPYGTHRVFARMKITGTQVATVNVKYQDTSASGAVYISNSSVTVNSTSWYVFDLGVIRLVEGTYAAVDDPTIGGIWALDASGTPAAGNLDVDYLFFMPTEGYITASGFAMTWGGSTATTPVLYIENAYYRMPTVFVGYGTAQLKLTPMTYTVSIAPIPGPFAIYWLFGTDTGSVFDVAITTTATITLRSNARYLMPSLV
jgi:hypothetical protein